MASQGTLYVARAMSLGLCRSGAGFRPGHRLNLVGNSAKAVENEGKALGEPV